MLENSSPESFAQPFCRYRLVVSLLLAHKYRGQDLTSIFMRSSLDYDYNSRSLTYPYPSKPGASSQGFFFKTKTAMMSLPDQIKETPEGSWKGVGLRSPEESNMGPGLAHVIKGR